MKLFQNIFLESEESKQIVKYILLINTRYHYERIYQYDYVIEIEK